MKLSRLISRFASVRIVRFLFLGGSAAAVNLLLMALLVDLLGWDSSLGRNLANVVSLEVSLVYSFFVYRRFVWNDSDSAHNRSTGLLLLRYHGSAGTAILTRSLILFPVLDFFGLHHLLNTLLGAITSCFLNYALSSRFVFQQKSVVPRGGGAALLSSSVTSDANS